MPARKLIKKARNSAKRPKRTRKLKAKSPKAAKIRHVRKPRKIKARPDQTTVRLGPHPFDRQPFAPGINVHPAPVLPPQGAVAIKHSGVTLRHH